MLCPVAQRVSVHTFTGVVWQHVAAEQLTLCAWCINLFTAACCQSSIRFCMLTQQLIAVDELYVRNSVHCPALPAASWLARTLFVQQLTLVWVAVLAIVTKCIA